MESDRETTEEAAGAHRMRFEPPLLLTGGGLDELVREFLPGARAVAVDFLDGGTANSNYRIDLVWDAAAPARPGSIKLRLSRSDEGPRREGALAERLGSRVAMPHLLGSAGGDKPEPHRRSLFTWIEGRTLGEVVRRGGVDLGPAARSFGRALAAVHGVHPVAFGRFAPDLTVLPSGGVPSPRWADDVARRVALRLDNPAHGLEPFRREAVRTRFARLLAPLWTAPPTEPSIVHGDLSAGNIILKAGSGGVPEFSGLIDWETARPADPAEDIASLRFDLGPICPGFVGAVEEAYREERGDLDRNGTPADRERRIALALVPILLEARMAAWRKKDPGLIARLDARLDTALAGGTV